MVERVVDIDEARGPIPLPRTNEINSPISLGGFFIHIRVCCNDDRRTTKKIKCASVKVADVRGAR